MKIVNLKLDTHTLGYLLENISDSGRLELIEMLILAHPDNHGFYEKVEKKIKRVKDKLD